MTSLSEYGNGNYYFIDNADELAEIFAEELKGLLSVVAQNSAVHIDYPKADLELVRVFGYNHQNTDKGAIVEFNDIASGSEKVALLKFLVKDGYSDSSTIDARMTFVDATEDYDKMMLLSQNKLTATDDQEIAENGENDEVAKYIALFEAADTFDRATIAIDNGEFGLADSLLRANELYIQDGLERWEGDSLLMRQYEYNESYKEESNSYRFMTEEEQKRLQKANKSYNYNLKKGRK